MIKNTFVWLFAAALALCACAPATATAGIPGTAAPTDRPAATATQEPVHVKVGILPYLSNGPLFIALDDGFFAAQGLDVEFVDFGFSDKLMIPALLDSEIDVGASTVGVGLLNAVAQGGDLKIVADKGFANPDGCANSGWLARKELLESGTLDDLSGLRGLKLVPFSGNTAEFSHDMLLEKAGLTSADIEVVALADPSTVLEALTNGSLDVAPHSEPWITRARKGGALDLWLPHSAVVPNMSLAVILYGPKMLDENSDVGVRFMTAYLKAIQQYNAEKSDHNVEIIAKYTKLTPEEIKEACWTSYQPEGKINIPWEMAFQQWTVEKHYVDTELSIEQVWDPRFVDQANANLNK